MALNFTYPEEGTEAAIGTWRRECGTMMAAPANHRITECPSGSEGPTLNPGSEVQMNQRSLRYFGTVEVQPEVTRERSCSLAKVRNGMNWGEISSEC